MKRRSVPNIKDAMQASQHAGSAKPLEILSLGTWIVLALALVNIALLLSGANEAQAFRWLGNVLYFAPSLTAFLVIFVVAYRRRDRAKLGWLLISFGLFALAAGKAMWVLNSLTSQPLVLSPFISFAYVLFGPLTTVGLIQLIPPPQSRREAVKLGLDLAVTVGALGLYGWLFFLSPALARQITVLSVAMTAAYWVVDLLLLSLVLVLIFHEWHDRPLTSKFVLIGLGFISQITGDVLFGSAVDAGSYYNRHPLEVFWTLTPVLFALAARISLVASFRGAAQQSKLAPKTFVRSARPYLAGALPYLAVISSLVLLLITQTKGQTPNMLGTLGGRVVLYGVVGVILLVLARYLLAAVENGQLNRRLKTQSDELQAFSSTLELKVQERTARLERLTRQFQHDARHDPLTGLANRAYFQECLDESVAYCVSFAVLYFDFDRFKAINDSYGHEVGDKLLLAISKRLRTGLRQEDVVARLGGDEFAILSMPKSPSDVLSIAEKLTQAFQAPFQIDDYSLYSTASIGVVFSDGRGSAQHVLRDADTAMYQAKALGKSRYVIFESTMSEAIRARLALENDLRRAIERQELEVHYQPIVRAADSRIMGFEALARWRHPVHGPISPVTFIPLAEESNLIVDVERWILQAACAQLKAWEVVNPQLTLSVNFSGRQFAQSDLPLFVASVLAKQGLGSHRLNLELTERLLLDNSAQVHETLTTLRELGLRLHIDDFGTGYSSLAYLQRFDADLIKVDRSFVAPMLESGDSAQLVQTIINLAHNLGMKVVAEGVETEDQLFYLKRLNCDYLQGYFFAKPLPAAEALQLLQAQPASEKNQANVKEETRTYRVN